MKKEREQFFKNITIDDVAMAKTVVEETTENIEKANKGIRIGLVSMALLLAASIIPSTNGILASISAIFEIGWLVTVVMTYVVGGGIKKAFSIGWKLAKITWFVIPVFPLDIVIAVCMGVAVLFAYFYTPVFFVWLYKRQEEKDLAVAQQYVAQAENVYYNSQSETV